MASLCNFCVFLSFWILAEVCQGQLIFRNETVCPGTSQGLVGRGDAEFRYKNLRERYENCTYIEGNLEIVFLDDTTINYNLDFLKSIKEVTGYVLIVSVYADYVPLENLMIIRGHTLYLEKYSLYVALNSHSETKYGLRELRMKSLTEILKGKVFFKNNNNLCFEETIIWDDINPREKPPVDFHQYVPERACGECHSSCQQPTKNGLLSCWGEGPDMCQKLSQGDVCHGSCENRCYGALPNQCCHPECAAGCTGPKKTDCLTCRNFNDDGACVPFCPLPEIYDTQKFIKVPNPNAKFTYGALCVKDCPHGMLKEQGLCVIQCPKGKSENSDGVCESCNGPCPRSCPGTGMSYFLTSKDLENFNDCTRIQGSLKMLVPSFTGDRHNGLDPIHPSNLSVFEYVKEITGNLIIQSEHKDFKNLSYFKSLEYIYGRETNGEYSLSIIMTKLESLELTNLKQIKRGNVLVAGNERLCYVSSVNWSKLLANNQQTYKVVSNADSSECERADKVCDPECSSDGCWGAGPTKCLSCINYHVENPNLCVKTCSHIELHYDAGKQICKPCHSQCLNNCTGPEPSQCDSCRNVSILDQKNDTICLEECPDIMYRDAKNICRECHENCANGCTGPKETVGPGGCNSCEVGFRKHADDDVISCLPIDVDTCYPGYHLTPVKSDIDNPLAGKRMCEPCHEYCETCNGAGVSYCNYCKYFRYEGTCQGYCPTLTYGNKLEKKCEPCHQECRGGCIGPSSSDCEGCNNFKIYTNDEGTEFNCTKRCPDSHPYLVKDEMIEETQSRTVCADGTHPEVIKVQAANKVEEKKKIAIIVGPSVGGVLGIGILIACIAWCCQKRARSKEKTAKLTARMTGIDEEVPLTPTQAKPDLAQLRLIKESDLRRGGIIGSGAFGTVYKGFWIPEGENVKIPVAIKVLQEGTSPNQNKELLEEARVMTSVDHPCCVRILAVCMTAQMMLITQLMPLGCLLDYVRKNKEHIGSKVLLNWCTQIAKGMVYLEERGIVHRDLAARNVLLHTTHQVKITDFGLAKLLDYDEEVYQAAGGKMPIKWLALECIQHRIFTHKSDVWSYGVTVWELMTYGAKPYDNIRARDVPDLLEKGERLPQPHCCTIDVYMIMIKCWMLDAESRPSFAELQEEFGKMARDPGRYLVIQGDKLMRLPSVAYDKQDLMRSLSVANDGPEEVMEADDYLQPHLNSGDSVDNPSQAKSQLTPLLPSPQGGAPFDFKSPNGTKPKRDKRYAHLDHAVNAQRQRQISPTRGRGDSVTSRYSSDPVQILKDHKEDIEMGSLTENGHSDSCKVPLFIPVDEDNYLQPKTQNPAAYMDLSDKGYYQNEKSVFDEIDEEPEDIAVAKPLTKCIDNPEYFDSPKQNGGYHRAAVAKDRKLNYYNDIGLVSPVEKKQLILKVNTDEIGNETTI